MLKQDILDKVKDIFGEDFLRSYAVIGFMLYKDVHSLRIKVEDSMNNIRRQVEETEDGMKRDKLMYEYYKLKELDTLIMLYIEEYE